MFSPSSLGDTTVCGGQIKKKCHCEVTLGRRGNLSFALLSKDLSSDPLPGAPKGTHYEYLSMIYLCELAKTDSSPVAARHPLQRGTCKREITKLHEMRLVKTEGEGF